MRLVSSICLLLLLSISLFLSFCLPFHQSNYLHASISIYSLLSFVSLCLPFSVFLSPFLSLPFSLSLSLYLFLSFSFCLSLPFSVFFLCLFLLPFLSSFDYLYSPFLSKRDDFPNFFFIFSSSFFLFNQRSIFSGMASIEQFIERACGREGHKQKVSVRES